MIFVGFGVVNATCDACDKVERTTLLQVGPALEHRTKSVYLCSDCLTELDYALDTVRGEA